jgi:hypothetical protein
MQINPVPANEWPEYFAQLAFADLQILIPQTDIYSLEPVADMTPPAMEQPDSVGRLEQSGHIWSLYALSSDLNVLSTSPESYRIVVLMKNVQPVYGLLCERVDTVMRSEISIHSMPGVMQRKNSPILALALHGTEIRYISSASLLSSLFLP